MKIIFDFDDVLMDTSMLKKKIASSLYECGVSKEVADHYYDHRDKNVPFSLKSFLISFLKQEEIESISSIELYDKIMAICPDILNKNIVQMAKENGKDNSFIVTNGDKDFQADKIKRSGTADMFCEIHVTGGSKKDAVEDICARYKNEKIIFVDNKQEFFDDLDMKKCSNLVTVLYDENGLGKLSEAIQNLESN